jgi:hypothetical protein
MQHVDVLRSVMVTADTIPGVVGNAQSKVSHVWLYGLCVANSRYYAHGGTTQDRYTERKPIFYTTTYIDRTAKTEQDQHVHSPKSMNDSIYLPPHPATTAPIYYRDARPLLSYPIIARTSIARASSEGVRRWQECERRFTHSWQYRHRACEETRPNSHVRSHTWSCRRSEETPRYPYLEDKQERHKDDARCALNAVIIR